MPANNHFEKKLIYVNKLFVKRVSVNNHFSKINVTVNKHFVNKLYSVKMEIVLVIYENISTIL